VVLQLLGATQMLPVEIIAYIGVVIVLIIFASTIGE
jgi:hypothetical protein